MIVARFGALVFCALLCLALAGCAGRLSDKIVVIPDTEEAGESADSGHNGLEVGKIYKLPEQDITGSDIAGWIDNRRVIGLIGGSAGRHLTAIDYQTGTREAWQDTATERIELGAVSPDGKYIALTRYNGEKETYSLLSTVSDRQEAVMSESDAGAAAARTSPLAWSNNSRYVAYAKEKSRFGEAALVVYDRQTAAVNSWALPGWQVVYAKAADDGASAVIVRMEGGQPYAAYGTLSEGAFELRYEHNLNHADGVDFISDDQIVLSGANGALITYDKRNSSTAVLLEQVGIFKLSNDSKYIVYSKESESLYAAKLQGNNVLNEQSIYKGIVPTRLDWSPDNKKILLNGRKWFEARPAPALQVVPAKTPLIIEFK
ncbi:hypothetical protein SK3146_05876 [Paenibacillus konkukensis]|uniref:Uncharacterized protein n=1 Tax=Paenibacillus konkukensis TaxID=2020716 RepID=A0ABY4RWI9_9BACL|nr:hypothetical protein [Paenibacillus konkukensis]UQZ86583.1 hypothetical protein SK3146_05876 [Paenibacillus konkukensis]